MTDKLNFSDLDSCCNTCSDKTDACAKDVETNCEKLKKNNGGSCIGGVNNEGFTELMKEKCGKTCADEFCPESNTKNTGDCDCVIDYCDLKDNMCSSITDRYECINRGCERGTNSNNFQCVNPGTQVSGVGSLPAGACEDSELICNMDKSGNIIYGKCIEDPVKGIKNFMSYNSQCVTKEKPIETYCKGSIPQLQDPCADNGTTGTTTSVLGTLI